MRKKFLAGILSLCMVATLMPVTAFAADNETAPVPTEPVVTEAPAEAVEPAPEITITLDESAPEAEVPAVEPTEPVVEPTEPEEPVEPETPAEPVVADTTVAAPVEEAPAMMSLTRGASDVATYDDETTEPEDPPVVPDIVKVNGQNLLDGGTVAGVTYDAATNTITMANVKIEMANQEDMPVAIYSTKDLTIILVGDNSIILNKEGGSDAIDIWNGDLTIKGDGKLTITTGDAKTEYVTGIVAKNVNIDGANIDIDFSNAKYATGIRGRLNYDNEGNLDDKTGNITIKDSTVNVKANDAMSANNVTFSGKTNARLESIAYTNPGDKDKLGLPAVWAEGKIIFALTPGGNVTAIGGDGKFEIRSWDVDADKYNVLYSSSVAPGLLAVKGIELGAGNILSGGQVKEIKLADGTSIFIIADANGNPVREVSVSNPEVKQASVLGTNTVKTGDHTSVALWMMLALVSAMGIAVVVRRKVTL